MGTNGALDYNAHPFSKGFKITTREENTPRNYELLVARFDPARDEWVADYGFYETETEKYVLHPIAIKFLFGGRTLPKEPTRAIFTGLRRGDVMGWNVRKTKQFKVYMDVLATYGFLKDWLLEVEYI
jgi:hypothetical protein